MNDEPASWQNYNHNTELTHSLVFLDILVVAVQNYCSGNELLGLEQFDEEWENIKLGQAWIAARMDQTKNRSFQQKLALLSSEYAAHGAYILIPHRLHESKKWFENAILAAQILEDREAEANHKGNLALVCKNLGDNSEAINLAQDVLTIARKIKNKRIESIALNTLGIANKQSGEFRRASSFYEQALALARDLGDLESESKIIGNIGNLNAMVGNYDRAIEHAQQQLRIARRNKDHIVESNALGSLANNYFDIGDLQKAIYFQEQWTKAFEKHNDYGSKANLLMSQGKIYTALGETEMAHECFKRALELAKEQRNLIAQGQSLCFLGKLLINENKATEAIELCKEALELQHEAGDQYGEQFALDTLGIAYFNVGDIEKAVEFFQRRLLIIQALGNQLLESETVKKIALCFSGSGDADFELVNRDNQQEIESDKKSKKGDNMHEKKWWQFWRKAKGNAKSTKQFNQDDLENFFTQLSEDVEFRQKIGNMSGQEIAIWLINNYPKSAATKDSAEMMLRLMKRFPSKPMGEMFSFQGLWDTFHQNGMSFDDE